MNLALTNNFHNSEAKVRVRELPATLTRSQHIRAARKLCGVAGCICGAIRGPQYHEGRRLSLEWEPDIFGDPVLVIDYQAATS